MLELEQRFQVNRQKRQQIGFLAGQVRAALKLTSPITMEKLEAAVNALGGRVRKATWSKHEASIKKIDGSFEIVIDVDKPERRQIFSLAHELGHLFVHMKFANREQFAREQDYIESYARSGYDEEEFEANEFAAALLMPEQEFGDLHARHYDVTAIAAHFGVSPDAALVRGRWLGVFAWS